MDLEDAIQQEFAVHSHYDLFVERSYVSVPLPALRPTGFEALGFRQWGAANLLPILDCRGNKILVSAQAIELAKDHQTSDQPIRVSVGDGPGRDQIDFWFDQFNQVLRMQNGSEAGVLPFSALPRLYRLISLVTAAFPAQANTITDVSADVFTVGDNDTGNGHLIELVRGYPLIPDPFLAVPYTRLAMGDDCFRLEQWKDCQVAGNIVVATSLLSAAKDGRNASRTIGQAIWQGDDNTLILTNRSLPSKISVTSAELDWLLAVVEKTRTLP